MARAWGEGWGARSKGNVKKLEGNKGVPLSSKASRDNKGNKGSGLKDRGEPWEDLNARSANHNKNQPNQVSSDPTIIEHSDLEC